MNAKCRFEACRAMAIHLLLLGAVAAQAGGYKIPDQSTRAMGMIDAFVAGADDASAVYYNPAGLSRLAAPEVINNIYIAHATMVADGPGFRESSDGRIYAVPSFFGALPLQSIDHVVLGVGVYSPFGLGSRWGDDTNSAMFASLGEIRLVNVNPTVAWQLAPTLAVGAGINYFDTRAISRSVHPILGELDFDMEGDGWGWNVGMQWQCSDTVTLGATYRSQVRVDYDGDVDIDGFGFRGSARTKLEFPKNAALGVGWQANAKLRIEVVAEWTDWSVNGAQVIHHNAPPLLLPQPLVAAQDWSDSWVLMLGAEYALTDRWTLRSGYGFNETPVPRALASPALPQGDTHAVAFGVGCKLSERITLDAAAIVAYGEKQTLNNAVAPPQTEYKAVSTFLSLGMRYVF